MKGALRRIELAMARACVVEMVWAMAENVLVHLVRSVLEQVVEVVEQASLELLESTWAGSVMWPPLNPVAHTCVGLPAPSTE